MGGHVGVQLLFLLFIALHHPQAHSGPVCHVVFNASGKILASGGAKQICVWDSKRVLSVADEGSAPLVRSHAAGLLK